MLGKLLMKNFIQVWQKSYISCVFIYRGTGQNNIILSRENWYFERFKKYYSNLYKKCFKQKLWELVTQYWGSPLIKYALQVAGNVKNERL